MRAELKLTSQSQSFWKKNCSLFILKQAMCFSMKKLLYMADKKGSLFFRESEYVAILRSWTVTYDPCYSKSNCWIVLRFVQEKINCFEIRARNYWTTKFEKAEILELPFIHLGSQQMWIPKLVLFLLLPELHPNPTQQSAESLRATN